MRPGTKWAMLLADITHWISDLLPGVICDLAHENDRPRCTWRDLRGSDV
ncbi:hypothetical protein [Pseudonocardia sp.]